MEQALRKYNRLIFLGFIALFAMLSAVLVNEGIAIQLAPFTVPDLPIPAKTEAPKAMPLTQNQNFKRTLSERCLFGCADPVDPNVCEEECAEDQVCQSGKCVSVETEAQMDTDIAVLSDLNVKLIGCMVAKKPEYSLALVTENSTNATYIVGVGEDLLGAEVIEIRRDRVMIRRSGRVEYIAIVNAMAGAPSLASSPLINRGAMAAMDIKPNTATISPSITSAAAEVIKREEAQSKEGVTSLGNNRFEIDRKAINDQLSNPQLLAKQAQIVPNYKDGKNHGIKLIGVQPASVYSKIGIQNGDIVLGIGGQKIDSQAKALQLLDNMRSQNNVKIEVERRGKTQTIEYTVK